MMKRSLMLVGAVLLLAGCGQDGGEFLGSWVNSKNAKSTMTVEKNDSAFIVRRQVPGITGTSREETYPATLQEGMLHINIGFGSIDLAIDKSSGHLVGGGMEYTKAK